MAGLSPAQPLLFAAFTTNFFSSTPSSIPTHSSTLIYHGQFPRPSSIYIGSSLTLISHSPRLWSRLWVYLCCLLICRLRPVRAYSERLRFGWGLPYDWSSEIICFSVIVRNRIREECPPTQEPSIRFWKLYQSDLPSSHPRQCRENFQTRVSSITASDYTLGPLSTRDST